ncbi:MAG: hypothetical protein K6E95_08770 [Lachnospiraceae bacterium]|nr:hypothetical protein [Lachnospiraceae bacterium]
MLPEQAARKRISDNRTEKYSRSAGPAFITDDFDLHERCRSFISVRMNGEPVWKMSAGADPDTAPGLAGET